MNIKYEEAWIQRWNDLYDKIEENTELTFLARDWLEFSQDEALEYIQNQAYDGYNVNFEDVWFKGKRSIRLSRGEKIH